MALFVRRIVHGRPIVKRVKRELTENVALTMQMLVSNVDLPSLIAHEVSKTTERVLLRADEPDLSKLSVTITPDIMLDLLVLTVAVEDDEHVFDHWEQLEKLRKSIGKRFDDRARALGWGDSLVPRDWRIDLKKSLVRQSQLDQLTRVAIGRAFSAGNFPKYVSS